MRSSPTRASAACVFLLFTALSCASSFQLSNDEQASLDLAMGTPLSFIVPRDAAIQSWDRAQEFVNRYSSMALRTTTESTVVSYETPVYQSVPSPVESGSSIRYGYSVSHSSVQEGIQYTVKCTPSSTLGDKSADQNGHIAAYYIMTGRIACARCIVR
ncbi:MAG TPA: hypothetical protein VK527_07700 [Candidatus Limnocylindrales bacterium]|jgi:hypothetical protein|nr:hypothetical protein [Candidatus Limnocylindrales bacterium]